MDSISVIKSIIKYLNIDDFVFQIVRHHADINWRQQNPDIYSKLLHIDTGIYSPDHVLEPVTGRTLLDWRAEELGTPEMPLVSLAFRVIAPDGGVFHIPMMNLHVDEPVGLATLRQALAELVKGPFFLMRTDRYYHVYAERLLTETQWRAWNLNFLMIDAIVSPRYIGHGLRRGFNLLRLNAAPTMKTRIPRLFTAADDAERTLIEQVRAFAVARHSGQMAGDGRPYCRHLFEVEELSALIADELGLAPDETGLIRQIALLHDVIEDTEADYEDVRDLAGVAVADLVALLSNDKRQPKSLIRN